MLKTATGFAVSGLPVTSAPLGWQKVLWHAQSMKEIQDPELEYQYMQTCRELDGERNRRGILRSLLVCAKHSQLPRWTSALEDALSRSRKRVNTLSARKSRLRRRLAVRSREF
jgi:hypothetical protein